MFQAVNLNYEMAVESRAIGVRLVPAYNAYGTLIKRPNRKTTSEDRRLVTPTKSIKY
jgi:hypothetical protein